MKDLISEFSSGQGRSIFPDERSISPDATDNATSIGQGDIQRQMVPVWEPILLFGDQMSVIS